MVKFQSPLVWLHREVKPGQSANTAAELKADSPTSAMQYGLMASSKSAKSVRHCQDTQPQWALAYWTLVKPSNWVIASSISGGWRHCSAVISLHYQTAHHTSPAHHPMGASLSEPINIHVHDYIILYFSCTLSYMYTCLHVHHLYFYRWQSLIITCNRL